MGRNPDKYIICSTYAQDLADDFGRKVRNQLQDKRYTDIFPDAELSTDSSSMRRFNTTRGGVYYAVGAGSAITGRGAHLLLIDDPIKGREEADSAAMRKNLLDWYRATAYTRLMPNGSVVLIQTRWHEDDLAGWILKETGHEGWDVIEFPAILNERAATMLELKEGDPLWEESYPLPRLQEIKKTIGTREWSSLYAQKPSVEEGNIIKRWWWKTWTREQPPEMDYILQSWDTAYTVTETSDYSACTTWGVFSGEGGYNLFLIDSFREKLTFPELKNQAVHLYNELQPDLVLVEAKASGWSLVQELMRTGIPITPFNPKKMDKLARVHSVAPLFEGGRIWAPDTDESADVMNQFAMFPNTKHDDLVDSTTQALLRLRKGWMVSHPQDAPFEEATGPKVSYW
jgi:predicted phage terminase large subunit-like protein